MAAIPDDASRADVDDDDVRAAALVPAPSTMPTGTPPARSRRDDLPLEFLVVTDD